MAFSREIEAFIKEFVKDLREDNIAIFAGAGMSKSSGFVDWPELLKDIAEEIGLKSEIEQDLIALAQFHVNQLKGTAKLSRKIIEEFSEQAELSETHKILARLPIRTYWTTNYDTLIEESLRQAYKVPDIKHSIEQLHITRPKRDAVIYKMHGDVSLPNQAILYKEQYERYYKTHEPFVTALSGDLVSKTFLFIGFSFTDPNLDYVLSRLHTATKRNHYCFMRREAVLSSDDDEIKNYKRRKQELRIDDLKRFGIQTLLINDYIEIPSILLEIESRFLKNTIFISGSAENFSPWTRNEAQEFVHSLSGALIKNNYRVINGFGWGIGSAVINGALAEIYAHPGKYSEDQLLMRPFPQFPSEGQDLKTLWEEYRQRMISLSGTSIFIFGNKLNDEEVVVLSNGVIREFEITIEQGRIPIPVASTGYAAQEIWNLMSQNLNKIYKDIEWIIPLITEICDKNFDHSKLVEKIIKILQTLGK
ncbi:SIR2 family protein [Pseudomonas chlororaphis]|uniref:SIR2 family protein n=1 Tax=Pseudomonas chlororaphis TaxID=587753 RepID=UPI0006A5D147|nr:SIR2 family protein [Pseudomonas chlororaphis]